MSGPVASLLYGNRLHLQHGPIDLVVGVDGDRRKAFACATARFSCVLDELVDELSVLRQPLSPVSRVPEGETASRMFQATTKMGGFEYLTPMAGVAGAVAETILDAMVSETPIERAYVNNGGDIALHLAEGQSFTSAVIDHTGKELGRIQIDHSDPVRGIATSGRHGRSQSLGIADSVTVLAAKASQADVAATLVANAVDLPGHPGITRVPASELRDDSDLGDIPVVTNCTKLGNEDRARALSGGERRAKILLEHGCIDGAALFLQGGLRVVGQLEQMNRSLEYV